MAQEQYRREGGLQGHLGHGEPPSAGRGPLSQRIADTTVESSPRICPSCSAPNPDGALRCESCGASFVGALPYQVVGSTMPALELTLEPGQRIYAPTGSLGWMTAPIRMRTVFGASPWAILGRALSGMTLMISEFTAEGEPGVVALTTRLPGKIQPLQIDGEHEYIMQKGSFLAAQESVTVSAYFSRNLFGGLFGGEGFVLQQLHGDGLAFAQIDGEAVQYELAPGQLLLVHPGNVAMFDAGVGFEVQVVRGFCNVLFGEGLFLVALQGPGNVWLQTMPFAKLVGNIAAELPSGLGGFTPGGGDRGGHLLAGGAGSAAGRAWAAPTLLPAEPAAGAPAENDRPTGDWPAAAPEEEGERSAGLGGLLGGLFGGDSSDDRSEHDGGAGWGSDSSDSGDSGGWASGGDSSSSDSSDSSDSGGSDSGD